MLDTIRSLTIRNQVCLKVTILHTHTHTDRQAHTEQSLGLDRWPGKVK